MERGGQRKWEPGCERHRASALLPPRPTRQRRWVHIGQPAPDCDQPPQARPSAPCLSWSRSFDLGGVRSQPPDHTWENLRFRHNRMKAHGVSSCRAPIRLAPAWGPCPRRSRLCRAADAASPWAETEWVGRLRRRRRGSGVPVGRTGADAPIRSHPDRMGPQRFSLDSLHVRAVASPRAGSLSGPPFMRTQTW
jgi:hypothetical protein